MVSVVIEAFGGMVPRLGSQVIPNPHADVARNTLLLSGECRGLRSKALVEDLRSTPFDIKRIYKMKSDSGESWALFGDETVDFVKGPLINDLYERYYWTSENDVPRMNTRQRIDNDLPGYILGVPAPESLSFTVTPSGGLGPEVTRAYVYTFETGYGEEGPPNGNPALATGNDDGDWLLENMAATVPDASERNVLYKNIYRTVTSSAGTVAYHFVTQIPLAQTSYTDSASTDQIASNSVLASDNWDPPPDGLIGLVAHPNGFLVGFDGRDIYFSVPYRPHAWPADYVISTQDTIKGLGVYTASIAVCTDGFPVIAAGIRPDGISMTKAQTANPCVSTRRGIVAMPFGVYYPTDSGLMLISSSGFQLATQQLITKSEWQRDYFPDQIRAVQWETQYVAFHTPDDGFMFAPDEPVTGFVELGGGMWTHSVIQNDYVTGDVYLVQDNIVFEWNPAFGVPTRYEWMSKEYVTAQPVNFSAFAVDFSAFKGYTEDQLKPYRDYNEARYAYPLKPLNYHVVNGVRKLVEQPGYSGGSIPGVVENKQPFHSSPLFNIAFLSGGAYKGELTVTVYADDELVASVPISDLDMYRLPGGFKARRWQFGLSGNRDVKSLKVSETGRELRTV